MVNPYVRPNTWELQIWSILVTTHVPAITAGAFATRVGRNRVRARLGTAHGSAPVRRRSASSDEPEYVTKPMPIGERRFLMRVLRTYAAEHRGKGGAAPLTTSAIHVAETMLFVLMDRSTGRLEHAYSWIAKHAHRVYQTACASVAQLETLGVLVVQRRCRRGDGPESPPWVQDTNLYRFQIPPKLMTWWNARKAAREARARDRLVADTGIEPEEDRRRRHDAYEAQMAQAFAEMSAAERAAEIREVAARVKAAGGAAHAERLRRPTVRSAPS